MDSIFPLCLHQVSAVEEPTTGASSSDQYPPSPDTPAITRYSQVQNQDDLVRFLRTKLLEQSEELKGMEAQLKTAELTVQVTAEREDFVLSELATIVGDLDCKFTA